MQIIADLEGTTRGPYAGCVATSASTAIWTRASPSARRCSRTASVRASRRRLGERLRTGSGISGDGEQEQSHPPSAVVCYGGPVLKAVALAETFAKSP